MALKLLQGPITLTVDPDDDDYIGADPNFFEQSQMFWLDEVGLVGPQRIGLPGGGQRMAVVNLDGVFNLRNDFITFTTGSAITYDYHKNKLLHWNNGINIPHTIEPLTMAIYDGVDESAGLTNISTRMYDRWLRLNTPNTMEWAALDAATNTWNTEYTFSPSIGASAFVEHLIPGPGTTVFIYTLVNNGMIVQYDWLNKTEVLPRKYLGAVYDGCWYSRRFDIFIAWDVNALNADLGEISIFANEVEPSALSAPAALTPVTQGRVSTIQTTLTGAQGEAVPNRRIDWSITAGNGTLLQTQSVTDEDGVAETQYRAELSGGVNPTIQASLTY